MKTIQNFTTIVTSRDRALFQTLVIARVLDTEDMKTVGRFASIRRTNRRLLKLVRAGLLRRWFVGTSSGGQKALYGLSPEGARLIGVPRQGLIAWKQDSLIVTSQFLAHQQSVNRVFLVARFRPMPEGCSCVTWRNFLQPISASVPLIPDGYFEIDETGTAHPMFLEVDLGTESSTVWKRKVELYLKLALSGEFERQFGKQRFRVLLVFPSERRMGAIRRTIAKRTDKLFWFSTEELLNGKGLFGSIWFRPKGIQRTSLPFPEAVQREPIVGLSSGAESIANTSDSDDGHGPKLAQASAQGESTNLRTPIR